MFRKPERSKRTHFFTTGSDFYHCGVAGPGYIASDDPERVDCGNCLRTLVKMDGKWGIICRWSQHCTGCTEHDEFEEAPERGLGCGECAYKGRVKIEEWVPVGEEEEEKETSIKA